MRLLLPLFVACIGALCIEAFTMKTPPFRAPRTVVKFGGSSLCTPQRMTEVAKLAKRLVNDEASLLSCVP